MYRAIEISHGSGHGGSLFSALPQPGQYYLFLLPPLPPHRKYLLFPCPLKYIFLVKFLLFQFVLLRILKLIEQTWGSKLSQPSLLSHHPHHHSLLKV